ncbi:hypothetical protein IV500_01150 [Paeniglutamicibacter antarcticus]|uniref:Uncharacterized protein n=1 Tax=Arthrobacter terrae TaxID=2935737 RepID=A0A931G3S4_9MICC|nr:hypothetical protein [Arthrobacter terrae]MBG0738043.1 hypothetical protein [Arthrobacter terrae]
MPQMWGGIDAGNAHRHCLVIDAEGPHLLSWKVANDEVELLGLTADPAKTWRGHFLVGLVRDLREIAHTIMLSVRY